MASQSYHQHQFRYKSLGRYSQSRLQGGEAGILRRFFPAKNGSLEYVLLLKFS